MDSADSAGAGSSGDSAAPIEYVLPYRNVLRTAVSVADPAAVEKAFTIGVGEKSDFFLGGSLAPKLCKPVLVKDAVVKSLHNGHYIAQGPAEKGQLCSIRKCAVLQAGQIMTLITAAGQSERDIQFFRGFGIDPALCRLVCVKACTSFRASYEDISAAIYNTATPSSAGHVLQNLPYERLKMPLYPFEDIEKRNISEPICFR